MRRTGERDKEFIPVEHIAAIHLARRGPKAPSANGEGRIRLPQFDWFAVWLPIEDALANHLVELAGAQSLVSGPRLVGHRQGIGNLAHHQHGQAVNVKGESRGGIALCNVLRHQTVRLESRPQAPVLLRDTEGEQPCRTQVVVVSEGK
jgi:hypothetical protein